MGKRFVIIGLPGSGKSTFACRLGEMLEIPVHHLDRHNFEKGGKKRDKREFLAIQQALLKEESWIVEGCSISSLEMRWSEADVVFYFHFSKSFCVWRVFKRLFFYDKQLSNTGCVRIVNRALLKYIWNFEKEKSASIEALRNKYPRVNFIVFKRSKEANQWLEKLKESSYVI